jgi:hypothetical protein
MNSSCGGLGKLALALALAFAGALSGCASADDETTGEEVRVDLDEQSEVDTRTCAGSSDESGEPDEERTHGTCELGLGTGSNAEH